MLAYRGGLVAFFVLIAGCAPAEVHGPGLKPCPAGQNCRSSAAGGIGAGSGGAGADAGGGGSGGGVTDASGKVVTVTGYSLTATEPYAKTATVYGDSPGSQQIGADYDGSAFTISGVSTGDTWFLVVPKDSTGQVFPTYSLVALPSAAPLALPVIDGQTLTSIVMDQATAVNSLKAQIILRVGDGKKPLAGISVASASAEVVAYDAGTSYSAAGTATGDRGVIVLVNDTGSSVTLTDAAKNLYHLTVRPEQGTATLLDVVL